MSERTRLGVFVLMGLIFFFSCNKGENGVVDVDVAFAPYLDRFLNEATERGKDIDFTDTGLKISFGEVPVGAAAVCSELGGSLTGSHNITVDKEYWDGIDESQRERIVFHELGHCELIRTHDNQIYSNGDWKSMMRGDPLPDKSPLVNYSGRRKEYYINELFDPTTAAPDWIQIKQDYDDISMSNKELIYSASYSGDFLDTLNIGALDNFEIEVDLTHENGNGFVGFSWGGSTLANSHFIYFFEGDKFVISTGPDLFGPLHNIDKPNNFAYQENKVTVRKVDQIYYFFINEDFQYWTDYLPITFPHLGSLISENNTAIFNSITVYLLK